MTSPSRTDRQIAFSVTVATGSFNAALANGVTRAILVDEGGDLTVQYANGLTDTIALAAGIWHPMYVSRINTSGTTATGIHAGY